MPDGNPTPRRGRDGQAKSPGKERWECRCAEPPILLAMYEPGGAVEIKLRDRYYLASGCVHATCPRCGAQHVLDLRPAPAGEPADPPATSGASGASGASGLPSTGG